MEVALKHLESGLRMFDSVELKLKGEEITRVAMARQHFQDAYAEIAKAKKDDGKKTEVKTDGR